MTLVKFHNADTNVRSERRTDLKKFISSIFITENIGFQSVDIVFCSDDYLLRLNKQFLNHDYYTDILTFDLSQGSKKTGEIYISIDRVKENSRQQKVLLHTEINRIIFHGILHLCGYNDKTKAAKNAMTAKENEYLNNFKSFHVKQKRK